MHHVISYPDLTLSKVVGGLGEIMHRYTELSNFHVFVLCLNSFVAGSRW